MTSENDVVGSSSPPSRPPVHPVVDRWAAYSWRLSVIAVAALGCLWLLAQARVAVFPIVIALFLTRALAPVSHWLRRHRWRPGLAAATTVCLFLVLLIALLSVVIGSIADEADSIGPTLTQAIDAIEDWLVVESPVQISRNSIELIRERAAEAFGRLARSTNGAITDQATLMAELVTGTVLSLILTFFMLRDGARFVDWISRRSRDHEAQVRRSLDAAWATLGGYLRGAALLGVVESTAITAALLVTGSSLVVPVTIVTFLGAFVPLAGAVVAGLVAVLVALVTGGAGAAIAVGVVAFVVQQLDNELLAPVIYGRALSLHPVIVLLSVVAGGALFGIAGTVLAVPIVAVAVNSTKEFTRIDRIDPK